MSQLLSADLPMLCQRSADGGSFTAVWARRPATAAKGRSRSHDIDGIPLRDTAQQAAFQRLCFLFGIFVLQHSLRDHIVSPASHNGHFKYLEWKTAPPRLPISDSP